MQNKKPWKDFVILQNFIKPVTNNRRLVCLRTPPPLLHLQSLFILNSFNGSGSIHEFHLPHSPNHVVGLKFTFN